MSAVSAVNEQETTATWSDRIRPAAVGAAVAEQAVAKPHEPNESTRKNMDALEKFLNEKFPVDLEYAMPFVTYDKDGHTPTDYDDPAKREARQKLFAQRREQNIKLHAAFARYKESASRPNPLFEYVQKHKAEGFSPEEISTLITYLAFRTNPTLGDLFHKDGLLHNFDMHTIWLRGNINDEAGGGPLDKNAPVLDPHVGLQNNSFAQWKHMFPRERFLIPDDICTYAIMKQLLLFRKEGIRFDNGLDMKALLQKEPRDTHTFLRCEQFNKLCHERGLVLPHHVRAAWLATRPQGYEQLRFSGKELLGGKETEILAGARPYEDGMNLPNGKFPFGFKYGAEEFDTALRKVHGMSDEAVDYCLTTLEHQGSGLRCYDARTLLRHELSLLTREANADKGSHIDAYRQLVETYAGYLDPKKLGKKGYAKAMEQLKLYADIHVSDEEGVEGSHADLARDLFLTVAHAAAGNNHITDLSVAPMLTEAFDHVVDKGYLHAQHKHMEMAVKEMEKARARAVDYCTDTKGRRWKDPFIKPKAEQPPRTLAESLNPMTHVKEWVDKTGERMIGSAGFGY